LADSIWVEKQAVFCLTRRVLYAAAQEKVEVLQSRMMIALYHPQSGMVYNFGQLFLSVCVSFEIDIGSSYCTSGVFPGIMGQVRT